MRRSCLPLSAAASLVLAAFALSSAGCAGSAGELYGSNGYQDRPLLSGGVFAADANHMLSEDAIKTLLASRIELPDRSKMAVFRFQHESPFLVNYYGGHYAAHVDFLHACRLYQDAVEQKLMNTGRFVEISLLPQMLAPEKINLRSLRETAAMTQSELLLVYRTGSELMTEQGFLFFSRDLAKARATVEIVVMDVRTGVIPYAQIHEAQAETKSIREDANIWDTARRAETKATLAAIEQAADAAATFLKKG